jgi:hypothetical protein
LVAAVFIACSTSACTLAGGAIGSAFPRYSPASVGEAKDGIVGDGEKVAVVRGSDGAEIVGRFRGFDARGLEVDTGAGLVAVDPSDVRSVSVLQGSHWLEGAALGFAVDVTVALIVGPRLAELYPDTSQLGRIHIGSDGVTVGAY